MVPPVLYTSLNISRSWKGLHIRLILLLFRMIVLQILDKNELNFLLPSRCILKKPVFWLVFVDFLPSPKIIDMYIHKKNYRIDNFLTTVCMIIPTKYQTNGHVSILRQGPTSQSGWVQKIGSWRIFHLKLHRRA